MIANRADAPCRRKRTRPRAVSISVRCALCEREVSRLTLHHLVPREEEDHAGRKSLNGVPSPRLAEVCSACHRQVHALYDNGRLARELSSVERLRDEPDMRRFLSWVRRQDPERRVRVHSSASRRRRR